eukprot:3129278-Prymnesium_polylepis.1
MAANCPTAMPSPLRVQLPHTRRAHAARMMELRSHDVLAVRFVLRYVRFGSRRTFYVCAGLTPSRPPVITKHVRERVGRSRLGLSVTE